MSKSALQIGHIDPAAIKPEIPRPRLATSGGREPPGDGGSPPDGVSDDTLTQFRIHRQALLGALGASEPRGRQQMGFEERPGKMGFGEPRGRMGFEEPPFR